MHKTSEKSILVPVGSTPDAMIVVKQSYNLARLTHSKIILLGVETSQHPFNQKQFDAIAAEAREKAEVPVETMIRNGNIYHELTKVADVLNPLFIIIRITEKLSPDKLVGRNAFKMVRQSKHAVITIRGEDNREGCKTIVLPLDVSRESREKVDRAIELALMFKAEVKIISILEHKSKGEEVKLHIISDQVIKVMKEKGVVCSAEIRYGKNIPKLVIDYAHEVHADLIVIMTQEKLYISEIMPWNMGTTAQQLINESDIPVLSFRPMERKDTTIGVTPY
jgi:nucleotide-binding universal stress UspA family protein